PTILPRRRWRPPPAASGTGAMLEFLIVLVLIGLNAFFALSEMSVVTSRKPKLRQMGGDSGKARRALELAEHPEQFLSTVQVGITLTAILTGLPGGHAIGSITRQCLAARSEGPRSRQ